MTFRSLNKKLNIVWPITLLGCVMQIQSAYAEKASAVSSEVPADSKPEQEAETIRRQFDLGKFQIRQLRPTRNETIHTIFELTLVLPKSTTERVAAQLENWKHRLRDQVITAVRLAESNDFSEPNLKRLRRIMMLRLNRVLKFTRIEGVYVTRFEFDLQ